MRIQTQGYSNKVWLSSDEGVINGTMVFTAATLEKILQAVNEKYGTSFEGWTQLPTAYEVGDTVPNWNAYEKIEIPSRKIALDIQPSAPIYIFGTIENDILHLDVDANEASWLAQYEGNVVGEKGPGIAAKSYLMGLFSEQGISLTDIVANIMQYEVGQDVPDWSSYEKIG